MGFLKHGTASLFPDEEEEAEKEGKEEEEADSREGETDVREEEKNGAVVVARTGGGVSRPRELILA